MIKILQQSDDKKTVKPTSAWGTKERVFNLASAERDRHLVAPGLCINCDSDAVSKLPTKWLGYRDAKLPEFRDDEVEP